MGSAHLLLLLLAATGTTQSFSSPSQLSAGQALRQPLRRHFDSRTRLAAADSQDVAVPVAFTSAHWMPVEDCLRSLNVSSSLGLSRTECERRLRRFGPNALSEPPRRSAWSLVKEQFEDRLVQILLSVALLSTLVAVFERERHALLEPLIIFSILLLNAFMGAWQKLSAESSLSALQRLQPETACVLREGRWLSGVASAELVPGDVILLRVGDKVPADARLIKLLSHRFCTDEASLTGESESVFKAVEPVDPAAPLAQKQSMVFAGTMVSAGAAHAVVVGTGAATEIGVINAGVQRARAEVAKTPLTQQLDRFGDQLAGIVGVVCVAFWLLSVPRFSHAAFGGWWRGALHFAKAGVSLGVAAIPEGLPAVITLCLALGTRRMAAKNVIVRRLSSIETLGCTSVICTDKTGTLTTNQMTVRALLSFAADENRVRVAEHAVEGVSYSPVGRVLGADRKDENLRSVALVAALCNDARLDLRDGEARPVGEPTEVALKVLVEKLGIASEQTAEKTAQTLTESSINRHSDRWASQHERLALLEFDRRRKSMGVLVRNTEREENLLLVKGAAEMLLQRCSKVQLRDGRIVPIDAKLREELSKTIQTLSAKPLRCLALAFKAGDELGELNDILNVAAAAAHAPLRDSDGFAKIESDLTLAGVCGIQDPARPEAAQSIARCCDAGIRVMMMTGDGKDTATSIARDVGILGESDDVSRSVFTGKEFFSLPEYQQMQCLASGNKVFCRAEPSDKQRLIKMLDKLGETTAMTGDGVNDAPALQQAAIGVAMGITGTEVAKSAADMVLADDNFSTIVHAVEEGRSIYANMQAFVCFLISSNIGEIISIVLSTLLGFPEPFSSVHLLWMNLVTDGPPATALSFNAPDPKNMQQPPRPKNAPLLSRWLLVRYLSSGLYVGAATVGAFFWWFFDKGVSFPQLRDWSNCLSWTDFVHSANAPHWPENPCSIFSSVSLRRPQTVALSVLVVMEMLKALSAVSLNQSLLLTPPWTNPWLLLSVALSIFAHLGVLYVPFLSNIFGLVPLSRREWKIVLMFSVPIILVEEILKAIGRRLPSDEHIPSKDRNTN